MLIFTCMPVYTDIHMCELTQMYAHTYTYARTHTHIYTHIKLGTQRIVHNKFVHNKLKMKNEVFTDFAAQL